jgi:hypothetical protein
MGLFSALGAQGAELPSTSADLYLLLGEGRQPVIAARIEDVMGSPVLYLRVEVDDMPSGRPRHTARFSLSGAPAAVRAVVAEIARAVEAAE